MKNQTYRHIYKENSTKSLNKFRYEGQKSINQLAQLNKKKEEGNLYTITTNTVNFSSNKQPSKKDQQQNKRIKMLQNELKKKLSEDNILRNLLKTKTHAELSHVDLFLQIRKIEQGLKNALQREKEQRSKFVNLQEMHKRQEKQHMRYIEMLDESIQQKERQWRTEKHQLQQENTRLQEDSQNYKFLLQQIKKKYAILNQKLKQVNDDLEIEREAKILGQLKDKQQYQNHISGLLLQIESERKQKNALRQQMEMYRSQIDSYIDQIEQIKDQKQKLQLRIKQFQQVNNDFNSSKRQEKERYQQYYQKIKLDYQKEIQSITYQQQLQMKSQLHKYDLLNQQKNTVETTLLAIKAKAQQQISNAQKLTEKNKVLVEQLKKSRDQYEALQTKSAKLSRELLQARHQREQQSLQLQKFKICLQQKSKMISKLQGRVSDLNTSNANLQVECEQYKKQAQANQSYLKLNNKVYNDNYKTLGRLIEINNKIKANLSISKDEKIINEQSLGQVVSYLTDLLQKFINAYHLSKKKHEELSRERNIQNRQIVNIIQQCKQFINNEETQNLLNKYLVFIKDRKSLLHQQSNQKVQVYHELIEMLMSLNSVKNYHSQNQHINLKDSLESTYLQRDASTSNKFTQRMIQKSDSSKLIRRRQRLSTEPTYDLPLKTQLFQEDQDKQNINISTNKNICNNSKETKTYVSSVRQKISSKLGEKRGESKSSLNGRSQIEKKYFRS